MPAERVGISAERTTGLVVAVGTPGTRVAVAVGTPGTGLIVGVTALTVGVAVARLGVCVWETVGETAGGVGVEVAVGRV